MNEKTQREKDEENFYAYLVDRGFPQESIIRQPTFKDERDSLFRPDFAIIDTKTNTLAVIEIANKKDRNLYSRKKALKKYISCFVKPVYCFFVEYTIDHDSFDLYFLDKEGEFAKNAEDSLLKFEHLQNAQWSSQDQSLNKKKANTENRFRMLCYISSTILFIVIILDIWQPFEGISLLTTERMMLLAAGIALILTPDVQSIKFLWLEIKNFEKNIDNKNNNKLNCNRG